MTVCVAVTVIVLVAGSAAQVPGVTIRFVAVARLSAGQGAVGAVRGVLPPVRRKLAGDGIGSTASNGANITGPSPHPLSSHSPQRQRLRDGRLLLSAG
jgi:hypothetical protein